MELLSDIFIKIIAQVSFLAFVIASASHGASQELGAACICFSLIAGDVGGQQVLIGASQAQDILKLSGFDSLIFLII